MRERIRQTVTLVATMVAMVATGMAADGRWVSDPWSGAAVWVESTAAETGVSWSGGQEGGRAEGFGVLTVWVGGRAVARYEGTMHAGRPDGTGRLETFAGDKPVVFEGALVAGKLQGKGRLRFPDGSSYTGDFVADVAEGEGMYETPAGALYRGGVKAWLPDGKGYLSNPAAGETYLGEFAGGRKHGAGVLYLASLGKYEGTFAEGHATGRGTFTSLDGYAITGEVWGGDFVGTCVLATPDGGRYEGALRNGVPDGEVAYIGSDGTRETLVFKGGRRQP